MTPTAENPLGAKKFRVAHIAVPSPIPFQELPGHIQALIREVARKYEVVDVRRLFDFTERPYEVTAARHELAYRLRAEDDMITGRQFTWDEIASILNYNSNAAARIAAARYCKKGSEGASLDHIKTRYTKSAK